MRRWEDEKVRMLFEWIENDLKPRRCDSAEFLYDEMESQSGECLPLETKIEPCFAAEGQWNRCITAKLNHFSVFKLKKNTVAANLNSVRVYPNPFYTNRGQGFVTIDRLPASAKVRIYTLSGDKVWEGTASTAGVLTWSAVNKSGFLIASGIYLAAIDSKVGKKVVKIAVER